MVESGDREGGLEEAARSALREFFAGRPEVVLAYLFGSRAEGRTGPLSDYDFGVLPRRGTEPDLRPELMCEVGRLLDTDRVDVVMLDRAPVELVYNVIAGGELLYERDEAARVDFEAAALCRYFDYLPVLRCQRRRIIEENK